ncbi:MAG: N-acetylglucosamine-6-phosphate deacetylase, partial [Coleofasciculaceae cyanobacterium RL_1_1]|nr:N-acetylglucosamine-6-phosphate deacetylase [Coleofasciculaceae cyanobacterium RL_1_1]
MTLTIINARMVGMSGLQAIGIDDRQVATAPIPMTMLEPRPDALIDVSGDWISPGGLDLQINGALGLAFPDVQVSDLHRLDDICRFLWDAGVDGFAPTIVTTSIENIHRSLAVFAAFQQRQAEASRDTPAAQIVGIHLEGPFLNSVKRGAHPEEFLLPLTLDQLDRVLGDHADLVKIVTLAPELDPTGETIVA